MPNSWIHLGNKIDKFKISSEKLEAMLKCPLKSALIDCNAATGTINAVAIPAGAYVYRVGVLAVTALAGGSPDIDVGDGTTADLYIDGLSALAANQLAMGGEAGSASADPHGGKYYETADTIDVKITATGAAGSIKILVWYDVDDYA